MRGAKRQFAEAMHRQLQRRGSVKTEPFCRWLIGTRTTCARFWKVPIRRCRVLLVLGAVARKGAAGRLGEGLALDGNTMRAPLDADGEQTHILGVVAHQTERYHSQKRGTSRPIGGSDGLTHTKRDRDGCPGA